MRRIVGVVAVACLVLATPPAPARAAAPAAVDDPSTVIAEDSGPVVIDVLANDVAGDGGPVAIASVGTPSLGAVTVAVDGRSLTYEPGPNKNGTDTFTYTASDGSTSTGAATVTVTITPVNDPPLANDDPGPGCGYGPNFGGAFPIPEDWHDPSAGTGYEEWFSLLGACGLLANDTDVDGDHLTYEILHGPDHGRVQKVDDRLNGWVAYDPDQDFSTIAGDQPGGQWVSDSFTYRAFDGQAYSQPATMRIWVAPVNDPPTYTPGPATVQVDEDSGPYGAAWATDVSPGPGASEAGQSVNFEVTKLDVTGVPNLFAVPPAIDGHGVLTFIPGPDQYGLAHVTVRPKDDGGLADYGLGRGFPRPNDTGVGSTFDIVVRPVPDPTIARDDHFAVARDAYLADLDVLANDSYPDADPLRVVSVGPGTLGTPYVVPDGSMITYTPLPAVTGEDTFTYTTNTGATATVTVTISGPDRAPTASDDTLDVAEGGSGTIDPRGNDVDLDGDPLTIVAVAGVAHGTAAITGAGTGISYRPAPRYHGSDTILYTVSDGRGHSATASIAVTVERDVSAPTLAGLAESFPGQAIGTSASIRLGWAGSDAGSGIARYEVQVSTDGGPYRTVPLAAPTSTSATRSLVPGTVARFRGRATDGEGNVGPFVAWPALTITRYQEATSLATYTGTWLTWNSASHSAGHARFASSSTRRVRLRFVGRDIAWVATRSRLAGRAQVRIDGVLVGTVDLHAGTTAYRRVVFSRHFATRATHTLEIRPVGDGRVYVDAFLVAR